MDRVVHTAQKRKKTKRSAALRFNNDATTMGIPFQSYDDGWPELFFYFENLRIDQNPNGHGRKNDQKLKKKIENENQTTRPVETKLQNRKNANPF